MPVTIPETPRVSPTTGLPAQVLRPTKGRANIFICFAPEDSEFAQHLDEALRKRRRVSALNWQGANVPTGFSREAMQQIDAAQTFLFIISPASIELETCRQQLAYAIKAKKVVVPILRLDVVDGSLPPALSALPVIDYREHIDYLTAFAALIKAVNTNLRIDVFICYARVDKEFANRLYRELSANGRSVWLDLTNIAPSTIWEQEIFSGIEAADNFVFLISPDSLRPESFCHKEFAHAHANNKRIIPLYYREVEATSVPPSLAQYQHRDFLMSSSFDSAFQLLLSDLDEDPAFLREHTRLLTRAIEWQRSGSERSLLLRGGDLTRAEALLRSSANKQPQFTNLQTQYVLTSREDANRARNKLLIGVVTALGLTILLAIGLFFQRRRAEQQSLLSQSRELVLGGEANIKKDAQLSLLLAIAAAEKSQAAEGTIDDRTASLLRRAMMAAMPRVLTATDMIEAVAWKPDSAFIAAGSSDGTVVVISAKDLSIVDRFDSRGWVEGLSWTSDGALLAAGTRENAVAFWNGDERRLLEPLSFDDQVASVSWRTGSRQLAVALARGDESIVRVIDWETRQSLFEVPGIRGVWSPNGQLLATGGGDGVIRIFAANGDPLAEMRGHTRYVSSIAWTTDGNRFATASVDDTVMVWDAIQHKPLKALPAEFALSVSWSPDGSRLASGSGSELVAVWDGNSYDPQLQFTSIDTIAGDQIEETGAQGYVVDTDWSPNGNFLAASDRGDSAGKGGSVLFLPAGLFSAASSKDWLALAKSTVRRTLTTEECKEFFHVEKCQ